MGRVKNLETNIQEESSRRGGEEVIGEGEGRRDSILRDLIGHQKVHQSFGGTLGCSGVDTSGSFLENKAIAVGDHSGRRGRKFLSDVRAGSTNRNSVNGTPQILDSANGGFRRPIGGPRGGTPMRDNISSASSEKIGTTSNLDSPVTKNADSGHKFRIRDKTRDKSLTLFPKNPDFNQTTPTPNSPINKRLKYLIRSPFDAHPQVRGKTTSVGIGTDQKNLSKENFFRPRVSPFEGIKDNGTSPNVGVRGKSQFSSNKVRDKRLFLAKTCNDDFKQHKVERGEGRGLAGTFTNFDKVGAERKIDKGKKKGLDGGDGKFRIEKESPMKKRKAFEIELHKMYDL